MFLIQFFKIFFFQLLKYFMFKVYNMVLICNSTFNRQLVLLMHCIIIFLNYKKALRKTRIFHNFTILFMLFLNKSISLFDPRTLNTFLQCVSSAVGGLWAGWRMVGSCLHYFRLIRKFCIRGEKFPFGPHWSWLIGHELHTHTRTVAHPPTHHA